jgi:hypothetical protein
MNKGCFTPSGRRDDLHHFSLAETEVLSPYFRIILPVLLEVNRENIIYIQFFHSVMYKEKPQVTIEVPVV